MTAMHEPELTPAEQRFLEVVLTLADPPGWTPKAFRRGPELVAVVPLDSDPHFDQLLWCLNAENGSLRCLMSSRGVFEPAQQGAAFELCGRINDGLVFGCAEFSARERNVVLRESCELQDDWPAEVLERATARLLQLGRRYAPAIAATLAGAAPAEAVAQVESVSES